MEQTNVTKKSIRKEALTIRGELLSDIIENNSRIISGKLFEVDAFLKCDEVYLYADYNNEVITQEIFQKAISLKKRTAFGKCGIRDSIPYIDFYYCDSISKLCMGYKGIREPDIEKYKLEKVRDFNGIVIVPLVAFDSGCNRIGYGKGFYDRFFAEHPDIYKIGLAYECQKYDEIPAENTDVKLDMVITEKDKYERN